MPKKIFPFLTKLFSKKYLVLILCVGVVVYFAINFFNERYATVGVASYYGIKFHGRTTASGQEYNMKQLTAAHRRIPFGTKVKVTNLDNFRKMG